MFQTNTEQCLGARNGKLSHGGSRNTHGGDRYGDCGNNRFANSSSTGEVKDNRISHLLITKDRPRSDQLTKILRAIPYLCQDKHYDYISNIVSTNTEPTQEYFLSDYSIKRRRSSKHHTKLGVINHFTGLNVPSGNSSINSDMVENIPISNSYPQVQHHPDHNQGLFTRSHEWNKLITDKKSLIELTLDQCDKATRVEITLGQLPEDDVIAG